MDGRKWRLGLVLGVGVGFWGATGTGVVVAQGVPAGGAPVRSGTVGANPFSGSYANPYLNPLMTQQAMSPGQAALFFLAAQQAKGGLGSGKLGGPASGLKSPGEEVKSPSEGGPRGSNTPGARASSYFNRSIPSKAGARAYYNRQIRYFPENGR